MADRIERSTFETAYQLLGFKLGDISSDAATAINCAFDMGYRTPEGIANMARKLLTPPKRD